MPYYTAITTAVEEKLQKQKNLPLEGISAITELLNRRSRQLMAATMKVTCTVTDILRPPLMAVIMVMFVFILFAGFVVVTAVILILVMLKGGGGGDDDVVVFFIVVYGLIISHLYCGVFYLILFFV